MSRWVLRYRGEGPITEDDVQQVAESRGVCIVDRSTRMLVVEGDEVAIRSLAEKLSGWIAAPEDVRYSIPDPRAKIRGS